MKKKRKKKTSGASNGASFTGLLFINLWSLKTSRLWTANCLSLPQGPCIQTAHQTCFIAVLSHTDKHHHRGMHMHFTPLLLSHFCTAIYLEVPKMEAIPMLCLSWDAWACEPCVYFSMLFFSHGASVCHPGGGRVLVDRLMLGSIIPGPSAISFSHVWQK